MKNYFDKNGNYINEENLSLAEIYSRGCVEGYKRGYTDAKIGEMRLSEEVNRLIKEDRLLDDRDGSITGRAHE